MSNMDDIIGCVKRYDEANTKALISRYYRDESYAKLCLERLEDQLNEYIDARVAACIKKLLSPEESKSELVPEDFASWER